MTTIRDAQANWTPEQRERFRQRLAEIAVEAAVMMGDEPEPEIMRIAQGSVADRSTHSGRDRGHR